MQRFDVTELLREGENVLGATVADGFYGSEMLGLGRYPFGQSPRRLIARLDIAYGDGKNEVIQTDSSWRHHASPVVASEIYHGETYEARLKPTGWADAGFDDNHWPLVEVVAAPACRLDEQESPPIRATMTLRPKCIALLANGDHVVDFGQNFAGWCRFMSMAAKATR